MNKYILFTLSLMLLTAVSCHKLDQNPKYGLSSEVVYSNPSNYIKVLAKIYSGISLTGNQGPAGSGDIAGIDEGFSSYIRILYNLQVLPTDEAVCGWPDVGIPELNTMTWSAENSFVKGMYYRIYYQITLANEFIRETSDEKMEERKFTEAQKQEIRVFRNEARFLRALSYYHAMDLFGNVPFVTESDQVGTFIPKRIVRADLYRYIESELLDVEDKLLIGRSAPYGRANNVAVQFLLAKLYLNASVYIGENKSVECAQFCTKIIEANHYRLDEKYAHLFLADNHLSDEIIFPIVFDGMYSQTWGGTTFLVCASIGGGMSARASGVNSGWAGLRVTPQLVDLFTDSALDGRYLFYTRGQSKEITSISTFREGFALPKFKNKKRDGTNGINDAKTAHVDVDYPMFRLADVYLMYAEAALRGGGNIGTGLEYVNRLRERAYGNRNGNLSSISLQDILDERARELKWECTRRTDLIRFGLFTESTYVWPFKGGSPGGQGVSSHLNLYPIPTTDLVINANLIQNPGY